MLLFLHAFLSFHAATAAYGVLLFPATVNDPEEPRKDADGTKPFRAERFGAEPAFEAVSGP